jgi:hypothetical protein
MKTSKETILEPILIVDSRHGVYGPKIFMESLAGHLKAQLTPEQRNELRDPENEFYWDTFNDVMNIEFKHNRQKLFVHQMEGDIYLVPACYARTKEGKEFLYEY